jgi:hypothetical protein
VNRYKVLLPLLVHTADASYAQHEEFEHEFTAEEEAANIASGLLEIVPRRYSVVGDSEVYETAKGEEFEAALLMENEAALIQAGHIERVEEEPKPAPKRKKKEAKG